MDLRVRDLNPSQTLENHFFWGGGASGIRLLLAGEERSLMSGEKIMIFEVEPQVPP